MTSILTSIKKMLGITEEYEVFDQDIIMHINTVFSTMTQLGVGPETGFSISGKSEIWEDVIQDDSRLKMIISYVYLRVKMLFDPPTHSPAIEAINAQIKEFEWRIIVAEDPKQS